MAERSNTRRLVPLAIISDTAALRAVSYRSIKHYLVAAGWTDQGPASNRPSVRVFEWDDRQVLLPSRDGADDHPVRVSEVIRVVAELEGRFGGPRILGHHAVAGIYRSERRGHRQHGRIPGQYARLPVAGLLSEGCGQARMDHRNDIRYFSQLDDYAMLRLLRWLLDDGSDAEIPKSDDDADIVANLLRRQGRRDPGRSRVGRGKRP